MSRLKELLQQISEYQSRTGRPAWHLWEIVFRGLEESCAKENPLTPTTAIKGDMRNEPHCYPITHRSKTQ